jgi:hypothetical protein
MRVSGSKAPPLWYADLGREAKKEIVVHNARLWRCGQAAVSTARIIRAVRQARLNNRVISELERRCTVYRPSVGERRPAGDEDAAPRRS